MKTVLRNKQGEIEYIHLCSNIYLTKKAEQVFQETTVTREMVLETIPDTAMAFAGAVEERNEPKHYKLQILLKLGIIEAHELKYAY
jgi:hypothetical protein